MRINKPPSLINGTSLHIQWNLCITDTFGTIIKRLSSFQRLKCISMIGKGDFGTLKSVLYYREVFLLCPLLEVLLYIPLNELATFLAKT